MAGQDRSNYQKKVISNYYDNLDNIMLTKLQEMVTELYLAESKAKADKLWLRVEKAMTKLKIKPAIIKHIMSKRSAAILAKNLEDWLKASK
jgi:thymidine phosphorylase